LTKKNEFRILIDQNGGKRSMNREFRATLLSILWISHAAMAARPLTVDDAGVAERGGVEVEAAVEYVQERRVWNVAWPLAITYGIVEDVEVAIDFGYQYEVRRERGEPRQSVDGLLDTVLSVKWNFREQAEGWPAMTVIPSVKVPTAAEGRELGDGNWDVGLLLIGTWDWETLALDANVGYTFPDRFRPPLREGELFLGMAIRREVRDDLWLVGEVFGTAAGVRVRRMVGAVAGGIQYQVGDTMTIDAAIGTGVGRARPRLLAGGGLTWYF
jgi:hypothetical protein